MIVQENPGPLLPLENHFHYNILKGWKAEHNVEKHQGIGISGHLIRKVGLVATILLGAPFALAAGILNGIIKLKEKYVITYSPGKILPSIRKMKQKEEQDKFKTMQNVLKDHAFDSLIGLTPGQAAKRLTVNLKSKLENSGYSPNKASRLLLRSMSRTDPFNPIWNTVFKEVIQYCDFSNEAGIDDFIDRMSVYPELAPHIRSIDWQALIKKVNKHQIDPQKIDQEIQNFEGLMGTLLAQLQMGSGNAPTENPLFIATLRKALNTPIYQNIKEDPSDLNVKLLHRFAVDMWNKAPSMEAYSDLGASIMDQMEGLNPNQTKNEVILAEQLKASHTKMEKLHYAAHGLSGILYAITHPLQILGALASEGGIARHVPGMFGLDAYDSHGTLANNPSLQGISEVKQGDRLLGKIHNCYGGSPTIGDHKIAPEFEAVLLAAENNQFALPVDRDENIPMIVNYNNLQNLDKKHGEGPRTRTIMLCNFKYPLSFRGTTFSKDSDMHLKPTDELWQNPADFGAKFMHELVRSFNPLEKGHGFYFHGPLERWRPAFEGAIATTTAHFEKLERENPDIYNSLSPKELQGAYQERVYSFLNSVIEMESVKSLSERGVRDFIIMVLTACKENIDRGGMENMKYLFTRLPETLTPHDWTALLMGAMHSRALSARDRVILKSRMPQILNFIKTTKPSEFRAEMGDLFNQLGYGTTYGNFATHLPLPAVA
ncbi:MAG: hypothetical protein H0V82_10355 [Candidatus Protochlamydia sp.]|nr:hypothetical protein [Candidatus Protochlamydia sp.]